MAKILRALLFPTLIFILSFFLFSFRLSEVPQGLTLDEAAFGHNAVLLSETFHDETNRPYPIFALSLSRKDWRQPVMQYFITGFFKVFGPSVYNLKLVSVILASLSASLIYILGKRLAGNPGALFSLVIFATTPIVLIQSHLGLDTIVSIPFTLGWLVFLYFFDKSKKTGFLFFSAASLGIGFYAYKGMRSFVPVFSLATFIYLLYPTLFKRIKKIDDFVPATIFTVSILPFFAVIPLLEFKYAGSVFAGSSFKIDSVYKFFYSYLASFDPSFLFVAGDEILHHSTGRHGMFLLGTLPFFLFGLVSAFRKDNFWKFIVISLFAGPLLFGFPGSFHRAGRLIALVPLFCLIAGLGTNYLWSRKSKLVLLIFTAIFTINAFDFLKYYWFSYAKETKNIFYESSLDGAYKILKEESESRGLFPYISYDIARAEKGDEGEVASFLRLIYFPGFWDVGVWNRKESDLPKGSILMTRNVLGGINKIDRELQGYLYYTKD